MFESNDQAQNSADIRRIRQFIHQQLIGAVDLNQDHNLHEPKVLQIKIATLIEQLEKKTGMPIEAKIHQQIMDQITHEVNGYGPLTGLMLDPGISDILINGAKDIWIDRAGKLHKTAIEFDDQQHLRRMLDRLLADQGKRLDSQSPTVDAKLPDGSRLHALIAPLCKNGPVVSIRRFTHQPHSAAALVDSGMLSQNMLDFLTVAIKAGCNMVIAGGASVGKTTLLNALSEFIPSAERVITIEESAELCLRHPHVISLEARQKNNHGQGGFPLRELLRNALRMRADRIIVGEVRGEEVFDMLQAMTVGHNGSMTTVHANHPRDVIGRLESLALLSHDQIPMSSIHSLLSAAMKLIVYLTRSQDGNRYVTHICEVTAEQDHLAVKDIFSRQVYEPFPSTNKLQPQERHYQEHYHPPQLLSQLREKGAVIADNLYAGYVIK